MPRLVGAAVLGGEKVLAAELEGRRVGPREEGREAASDLAGGIGNGIGLFHFV